MKKEELLAFIDTRSRFPERFRWLIEKSIFSASELLLLHGQIAKQYRAKKSKRDRGA